MPAKRKRKVAKKKTTKRKATAKKSVKRTSAREPKKPEVEERIDDIKLDYETSKIIAAISYIIGILAIIPYFLVEKKNKFVRFHAMQGFILGIAWIVLWIVVSIVEMILGKIPFVGWILAGLLWLAYFVGVIIVVIYLAYQAYLGKTYRISWISNFVDKYV